MINITVYIVKIRIYDGCPWGLSIVVGHCYNIKVRGLDYFVLFLGCEHVNCIVCTRIFVVQML